VQKLPVRYQGSPIELVHGRRAVDLHVHHHAPPPSRALMVFAAWLAALGVLGLTAGGVVTGVFALTTFAVLVVANQAGWSWVRRS
jgi:hypothetical protein